MSKLLDSFWRAAMYCLHPRVIALSILPLVVIAASGVYVWSQEGRIASENAVRLFGPKPGG